jgi:hypothetical protein
MPILAMVGSWTVSYTGFPPSEELSSRRDTSIGWGVEVEVLKTPQLGLIKKHCSICWRRVPIKKLIAFRLIRMVVRRSGFWATSKIVSNSQLEIFFTEAQDLRIWL